MQNGCSWSRLSIMNKLSQKSSYLISSMSNPSQHQQSFTSKVSRTNIYLDQQYVDHSYIDYANAERDNLCMIKDAALLGNGSSSSGLGGSTRAKPSFPYKASSPHHMHIHTVGWCIDLLLVHIYIIICRYGFKLWHMVLFFIVHSFTRYSIEMIYPPSSIGCPTVELLLSNGPRP